MDADLAHVRSAQDTQADTNRALWSAVNALQAGLAVAETLEPPPHPVSYDEEFTRAVDRTIVKVNAAVTICTALLAEALGDSLAAAAEDQWKIEGSELDQRFTIVFTGAGGLAARRAAKFLASMRLREGCYQRFHGVVTGYDDNAERYSDGAIARKTCTTDRRSNDAIYKTANALSRTH